MTYDRAATAALIRERRAALGLTQRQLAALSGCSQPSISNYTHGHRHMPLPTAVRVAEALGVTLDELARGELSPIFGGGLDEARGEQGS